ncbi:DUF2637 domain-containing protein [Streptomyces sp. NPDC002215]|uniref:DUF2637 domain-containing protein n=1 Tax=Streptomyces sp. NPDC002215 TaxID=3154412 RepID=UPI003332628C
MIVGVVVGGAVVIAAIGFAGSYAAVRDLAIRKGFGTFAHVFPLGVDAGILVLLALDLLLTWLRMPFPLLRQTAWGLTSATIAFNGAAAWPDPLGVGMHAVIPVLFVVTVEAARHAIGRLANITAGRHMEPVRPIRWLLSPFPTFRLWRRMKLWELRSYGRVLKLEQERLIYQARLRARFGRAWRRKAPVADQLPLKLTHYGVPLDSGRTLTSAPAPTPERDSLDIHVADALALASAADAAPWPLTENGRNVSVHPVNAGAGMSRRIGQTPATLPATVSQTADREPEGPVDRAIGRCVDPPVHAPLDGTVNGSRPGVKGAPSMAGSRMKRFTPTVNDIGVNRMDSVNPLLTGTVNGSRVNGSRHGVKGVPSVAGSRMKRFTPTVNDIGVNRMDSVNPLLTGTVNGFTPIVNPCEYTRESGSVNWLEWGVKQPVELRVMRVAGREPGCVNAAANEPPDDREEQGVNGLSVNSHRSRRTHAAKAATPSSVHATVDAPSPEEAERAKAAADWFAAKSANPGLTQRAFVKELGRSQGWMSKALKEAAHKAKAAADG